MASARPQLAVLDYGMGNLFSVMKAATGAGLRASLVQGAADLRKADAILIPGVGSFGSAMDHLRGTGCADAIQEAAASGKKIVGICLGMQLLMRESTEFGLHQGLGLFDGRVVRLPTSVYNAEIAVKVPHVAWAPVHPAREWTATPMAGVPPGAFLYFVHSYCVEPESSAIVLATTNRGDVTVCSALMHESVFACQFHPERSGEVGQRIYAGIAAWLNE